MKKHSIHTKVVEDKIGNTWEIRYMSVLRNGKWLPRNLCKPCVFSFVDPVNGVVHCKLGDTIKCSCSEILPDEAYIMGYDRRML